MNPSGVYRVGATLRSLWRRPSSVKDFWKLYEHSIEAADRLSKFIIRCLDDLPALTRPNPPAVRNEWRQRSFSPCLPDTLFEARCRFGSLREPGPRAASRPRTTPNDAAHSRARLWHCRLADRRAAAGQVPDAGIPVGIGGFGRVEIR